MPLGIVSDSDFNSELNNSNREFIRTPIVERPKDVMIVDDKHIENPIITSDTIIKKYHPHGRHEDDVNVPQSLRKLIGDAAITEGRPAALEIAEQFGLSNSSVATYTNPDNGNLNERNSVDILNMLTTKKVKISKRALGKLNLAMGLITEEKLKDCKVETLSAVAKNMAQVAKNMEPSIKEETKSPVQFVMFAPQINNENKYQTVIAKDNY